MLEKLNFSPKSERKKIPFLPKLNKKFHFYFLFAIIEDMKKLLIIPVLFCFAIAVINIYYGNFLGFGLWLAATVIISIIFLPIVFNTDDKNVPIYQIFVALPILFILFFIVSIRDFVQAGQPVNEAFIYGIGIGLATIGVLMVLKGNGK
jgi:hypothetical protein